MTRTMVLTIQKQPGTNTVAVVDAVKALLPTFARAAAAGGDASTCGTTVPKASATRSTT